MHYYMLMKQDNKTRTYMFIGIPGSGKSNMLFKFLRQKILEKRRHGNGKMTEPPYEVISFNDFNICAGEMCRKICRMMSVPCKTEISKAPEDYSLQPGQNLFCRHKRRPWQAKICIRFLFKIRVCRKMFSCSSSDY